MNDLYKKEIIFMYNEKKEEIKKRLREFKRLNKKNYFDEFIFCILTPQSKAEKCWFAAQKITEMKNPTKEDIVKILKRQTRFHNNKTKYVLEAIKKWPMIKKRLNEDPIILRNWLAKNVKGYGLKESSHFLRNIGKSNNKIAILDRHILKNLVQAGLLKDQKIKSTKHYLEIEKKYLDFSDDLKIPSDELDLLLWSKENGKIFK